MSVPVTMPTTVKNSYSAWTHCNNTACSAWTGSVGFLRCSSRGDQIMKQSGLFTGTTVTVLDCSYFLLYLLSELYICMTRVPVLFISKHGSCEFDRISATRTSIAVVNQSRWLSNKLKRQLPPPSILAARCPPRHSCASRVYMFTCTHTCMSFKSNQSKEERKIWGAWCGRGNRKSEKSSGDRIVCRPCHTFHQNFYTKPLRDLWALGLLASGSWQ